MTAREAVGGAIGDVERRSAQTRTVAIAVLLLLAAAGLLTVLAIYFTTRDLTSEARDSTPRAPALEATTRPVTPTPLPVRGERGPPGSPGPKGDKGDPGPRGPVAPTEPARPTPSPPPTPDPTPPCEPVIFGICASWRLPSSGGRGETGRRA